MSRLCPPTKPTGRHAIMRVYGEAGKISSNLEAWLRTLDQVRPGPNLGTAASADHLRDRGNMSEIMLRMQEFLQAEMLDKDINRSGLIAAPGCAQRFHQVGAHAVRSGFLSCHDCNRLRSCSRRRNSAHAARFGKAQSMINSGRRNKTYGGDHGRNS